MTDDPLAFIKLVGLHQADRWGHTPDWTITARYAKLRDTTMRGRVLGHVFDTDSGNWRIIFQRSDSNMIYAVPPDVFAELFELQERLPT